MERFLDGFLKSVLLGMPHISVLWNATHRVQTPIKGIPRGVTMATAYTWCCVAVRHGSFVDERKPLIGVDH